MPPPAAALIVPSARNPHRCKARRVIAPRTGATGRRPVRVSVYRLRAQRPERSRRRNAKGGFRLAGGVKGSKTKTGTKKTTKHLASCRRSPVRQRHGQAGARRAQGRLHRHAVGRSHPPRDNLRPHAARPPGHHPQPPHREDRVSPRNRPNRHVAHGLLLGLPGRSRDHCPVGAKKARSPFTRALTLIAKLT